MFGYRVELYIQSDVCRSVVAYFSADFGLESNYAGGHLKELWLLLRQLLFAGGP